MPAFAIPEVRRIIKAINPATGGVTVDAYVVHRAGVVRRFIPLFHAL